MDRPPAWRSTKLTALVVLAGVVMAPGARAENTKPCEPRVTKVVLLRGQTVRVNMRFPQFISHVDNSTEIVGVVLPVLSEPGVLFKGLYPVITRLRLTGKDKSTEDFELFALASGLVPLLP